MRASPSGWHAWLRGGVGRCQHPWAGGLRWPIAWDSHEAAAEEIQMGAATHLALHHFEAIDMPLDRVSAPGQRHPRFDGGIVVPEPVGKTLHRLQGTRSRAFQPGIQLCRLPLADQRGEICGEIDRLGDLGLLGAQQGELLGLGLGALRLTAEHQPGRPTRGERLRRRLGHDGERLASALAARWYALGLADTADIGSDAARAPGVAPRLELTKELDGGVAPSIPAREDIVLRGIEDAPPVVAAMLPYGPRGQAQIALDGAAAAPDLRGDGGGKPALAVQGPHLVIERVPPGRTLGRLLLDKRGRGWGGYRLSGVGFLRMAMIPMFLPSRLF